jgi:hypothetical protein
MVPQFISLSSDNGEVLGAALGFQARSRHKLLSPFTRHLWLDAMPVVSNNNETTIYEFLRLLESHASRSGCIKLSIGSFASKDCSAELEKLGFDLTERFEFELRLDRSEEELWRGQEHKRRKNIGKAQRSGAAIIDLPAEVGIPELRRLQVESGERILRRGGPRLPMPRHDVYDPVRVLLESGFGRILGAKVNDTLVSVGFFTCFNGLVYYTLSGHSQKALETQAPTLLVWESIKRYRNEGAKRFNLSGVKADAADEKSSEHGVYVYKKAFGAECLKCHSGEKIFHKTRYKMISSAKALLGR